MTPGAIKEYFRQIRREQLEILHLAEMIKHEELTLLPKAVTYDKDKVQVSPEDILARSAAEIVEMQEELGRSILILKRKKARAESMIIQLESSDEREVMRYYYLDSLDGRLLKWDDVATKMHREKRQIFRIHGNALSNLSKVLKDVI